jgi:DNA-binding LytR/AlgR family response regulator
MKLNCIITDDEPIAQEILEDYISMVPELHLVAKCADAMETFSALRKEQVDILFIDIQMPEITGLDFIRSLKTPPAVIFTTAYPNYAIDGFELDAVDYLLKPIPIDRFLKSINKIFNRLNEPSRHPDTNTVSHSSGRKFFFVKSSQDLIKIDIEKILYVEGLENYVRIHCEEKSIVSFSTMKNMEDILGVHRFLRIHRSYIVNMDKVEVIQNCIFKIRGKELIVGKSYRKNVSELVKSYYSM